MNRSDGRDLTQILRRVSSGEETAEGELLPMVYQELRKIAQKRMGAERPGHTLQATELVHEAYIQLAGNQKIEWRDRGHFFGAAAEAMRRILVDHARKKGRSKRGGDMVQVPLNVLDLAAIEDGHDILALDEAIDRLEEFDPDMSKVVRLRFFVGLSVEETAKALDISTATVKREWSVARAWLYRALDDA